MKIKSKISALLLAVVCVFGCLAISACGSKEITVTNIEITSGIKEVEQNATPDFNDINATITFSDKSTKKATFLDLVFDSVDTSTLGLKDVNVSYKKSDKKFKFQINVVSKKITSVGVSAFEGTFDGEEHNAVVISDVLPTDVVSYSIDNQSTWTTVAPKFKDVGEYKVFVKIERENFQPKIEQVTCKITKIKLLNFSSKLLTMFKENSGTKTNKKEEFIVKEKMIAGNENTFDLQISGTYAEGEGVKISKNLPTSISMQILTDGNYQNVDFSDYATLADGFNKIKFNSNATGKTIKLIVSPLNVETDYQISNIEFNIDIVAGYNVYTAKDLSVVGNDTGNGWAEWKNANGYSNITTNTVILQNDISITDSDIPSNYFYSESEANGIPSTLTNQKIAGSMKDTFLNIYQRTFTGNSQFNFIGNYFQIDYSKLSRAVVQSDLEHGVFIDDADHTNEKIITTHTSLFKFVASSKQNAKVNFKSLQIIGNGQRSERSVYSGGIMIAKFNGVNAEINNCIHADCFIGFMFDCGSSDNYDVANVIKNSKGYNSYNTLIYVWGTKSLTLLNSEFIGAGGPVMIVDDVDGGDKTTVGDDFPSFVTAINCKLESYVTGYEPWFASYGATALVPSLKEGNKAFTQTPSQTTFLQTINGVKELMNLKVVYKSGSAEGLTGVQICGKVSLFDSQEDFDAQNRTENPEIKTYPLDLTTYSPVAINLKNPIAINSKNGLIAGQDATYQYAAKSATGTTDINMILPNGMGIILELYSATV